MFNIPGMKWYVAKLVYQVVCGDGLHAAQFDEQFRLIRADELQWAWEKAQIVGKLEECGFLNERGEKVLWKFVNVAEVYPITAQEDGAVLFSQTVETGNAADYISLIHEKASRCLTSLQQAG